MRVPLEMAAENQEHSRIEPAFLDAEACDADGNWKPRRFRRGPGLSNHTHPFAIPDAEGWDSRVPLSVCLVCVCPGVEILCLPLTRQLFQTDWTSHVFLPMN